MAEATVTRMKALLAALEPVAIDIVDDSARHAGHAGAASGGGHYTLALISPRFCGLTRLARHRLVYDALDPLMRGEIHALSLNLQTPDEAGA